METFSGAVEGEMMKDYEQITEILRICAIYAQDGYTEQEAMKMIIAVLTEE